MRRLLILTAPLLGLTSCSQEKTPWWEQVEASGPCHEANLLDGLDTNSSDELRNIAYCLNQHGNLDPLMPLVDALVEPTRDGEEAGTHMAQGLADLLDVEFDVFGLASKMLDWMESDSALLDDGLHLIVELTYGQSYASLEGQKAPTAQSAITEGVLAPLLGGMRSGLVAALDADLAPLEMAESALYSDKTVTLLHSLAALVNSTDAGFKHRMDDFFEDLGQAIRTAQSPNNDRTPQASGNSLRDLVEALILNPDHQGRRGITLAKEAASDIFEDNSARDRVLDAFEGLQARDALRTLPFHMRYLGSVDNRGGALNTGEDSALVSMLRLLNKANHPVECSINWGLGSYEIDLGNLSVAIFEAFAELDPNVTTDSVDLLGDILGLPLTDAILQTVAALGVCPVLNEQFVDDLQSIDRLNDTGAGNMLLVLVEVLKALGEGSNSRIPEMVDLASIPHEIRATEALEEFLRDLGGSALLESMAAFAGPALSPNDYIDTSKLPEGISPLDFDDLWQIIGNAFETQSNGQTPLEQLEPLLYAVVANDKTWEGVNALGALLGDSQAVALDIMSWLPELVEMDPDLELTRSLAGAFLSVDTAHHFAQVLEVQALYDALVRSSEEAPGPLPFLAELQLSGTLEALLGTIDRVIGLLVVSNE